MTGVGGQIVNQNGKLGSSLAGGGTVTPDGAAQFSWAGYESNGGAKGNVNLYISKTTDEGATWTTRTLDVSASPPDCSAFSCGWAYLGAQMTLTSDSAGTLYALWNAGSAPRGPERVYFARSADGGNTWTAKQDISTAPQGSHHAFPAISAAGSGGAGQYGENPPTGNRWRVIVTGMIGGVKTIPYAIMARILSGKSGKRLAMAASKIEPNSPAMGKIVDELYKLIPRASASSPTHVNDISPEEALAELERRRGQ